MVTGDYQSMIVPGSSWLDETSTEGAVMYSQVEGDYNTLISNNARVYKGGSSRNDLGFRCAMTRVGSPGGF